MVKIAKDLVLEEKKNSNFYQLHTLFILCANFKIFSFIKAEMSMWVFVLCTEMGMMTSMMWLPWEV